MRDRRDPTVDFGGLLSVAVGSGNYLGGTGAMSLFPDSKVSIPDTPRPSLLHAGLSAFSAIIFGLDWALPASLTIELLQVPVVLLTLFLPGRRAPWIYGGLTTLFVGLGYALHPGAGNQLEPLINRGLVLAGLWLAVAAVLRYKQVRRARRESQARAEAILETAADGIMTIRADGTIELFNPAAEEIFGYSAEEARGLDVERPVAPPHRELVKRHLRHTPNTDQTEMPGIEREMTGRRKDGSTFPMELSINEVKLDDRVLFTGMVRDISERRRLEREILNASEEERRRIGQDLHDDLGQMLTGIGLLSQDLARDLEEECHRRADDMAEITDHIKEADERARTLSHGLVPVDIAPNGLVEALRRLADDLEGPYDVECRFREIGPVRVQDSTVATHLYRIAQEAVNNALRHGNPEQIGITLSSESEGLQLRIEDDGTGFDPADPDEEGIGLRAMQYRARLIGGTLGIDSRFGEGTAVTCTLPHPTSSAEESGKPPGPAGDGSPPASE